MLYISEEFAVDRGRALIEAIERDVDDRAPNISKQKRSRSMYWANYPRKLRYTGQPNVRFPVIAEKVEGVLPKLINAFFNAKPLVHVRRIAKEHNLGETKLIEQFINWALESDIPRFHPTFQQWVRNMLIDGVAVVKPWWDVVYRKTTIIEPVKINWKQGDELPLTEGMQVQEDRIKLPDEILAQLFGGTLPNKGLTRIEPIEDRAVSMPEDLYGQKFFIDFVEDRKRYVNVEVEFQPSQYIDEIDVYIQREIEVCNNPVVDLIEFEDIIVPYRTQGLQPDTCNRVAHKYWLSYDEIAAKRINDGWMLSDEDMKKLKAQSTGERQEEMYREREALKRQKDEKVGERDTNTLNDAENSMLCILEVYVTEDRNEDGICEEVIYQIPYCLRKIVQAHHLEELFPHSRRPFVDMHYIRISDRWYSTSLAELLTPLAIEIDSIVNLVTEAQEIINNPWFFYVPTSSPADAVTYQNGVRPGQGVPVLSTQDVLMPAFPQQPLANLAIVDSLIQYADKLTISPQSMGSSQARNAPRTARGTLALLSEAGIKLDMLIKDAQETAWPELMQQIHALYSHFGADEKYFYVTGEEKPQHVTCKDLRGRFKYSFSGNTVNTNPEIQRSYAQIRYNTFMQSPLMAQDLNAMQELMRDFANYWGEGVDIEKIIPKIPQQGGSHPPYNQAEEIQRMLQGQIIDVLPMDNHIEHIQMINAYMQGKPFEMWEKEQVAVLAMHMKQHTQFFQQQQQQGGTVQPGGTQANNIPSGMSAAGGSDMEMLEGGIT